MLTPIFHALECEYEAMALMIGYGFTEADPHIKTLRQMAQDFRTLGAIEPVVLRDTSIDGLLQHTGT
jgi:hypothetical protein